MKSLSTNYSRGLIAEIYAGFFLILKGYKIREWRYKTSVGEIDFIISKNNITAFVEVKLRSTKDEALLSITPKMKSRISRAAQYYLARQLKDTANNVGKKEAEYRFDVIGVSGFRIWHLDNAWFTPT
ncbi:MAG: YraN family protein [Alphaproteobacteria bacterium]|jgi:putative endonuclease|nr:YraN family protein [Alphaproteobacteria bacterium]MCB1550832.1 YraN family protein [Alphaproteobacteria bacterium]MCB9984263.1 YraN family protein [Micavibrio sp.]HPQ51343.1 YraN family protein [Alphaproteobacteria bacterium]HRK97107.1 YraN family protein [Alphaproteobacteria bacterium]